MGAAVVVVTMTVAVAGVVGMVPVDWSTYQYVSAAHWWRLLFICESLLVDWERGRGAREERRGEVPRTN